MMMMMMKMRWMCFAFLFNCLIYHTNAQDFICNSITGYDIKTLTSVVEWRVTTDYQCLENLAADCTFNIAFCQAATACFNSYSACQNATGSNVTILGGHTTKQFFDNDTSINGFYARFPPGPIQNISNTTYCQPKLRINFICDLNAHWRIPNDDTATGYAPEPTDINIDPNDPCSTTMIFSYAGACKNGQDPTKNGISPAALFLIMYVWNTSLYFIVGAIYNGLVKHRSGINLIPNAKFWIGLPLYAIEGCRASLNCCSGTTKPSQATYESV